MVGAGNVNVERRDIFLFHFCSFLSGAFQAE